MNKTYCYLPGPDINEETGQFGMSRLCVEELTDPQIKLKEAVDAKVKVDAKDPNFMRLIKEAYANRR